MVDISRETYGIETKVDYHGILQLNEKHIEEGLDRENLQVTTVKYPADHKKQIYELANEPKNNNLTEALYKKNQ